jgi:hypothetical protein
MGSFITPRYGTQLTLSGRKESNRQSVVNIKLSITRHVQNSLVQSDSLMHEMSAAIIQSLVDRDYIQKGLVREPHSLIVTLVEVGVAS